MDGSPQLDSRTRFLRAMEYLPVDRVPNHELGVWPQTRERWEREGLKPFSFHWDWFEGEEGLDMDCREFIPVDYGMRPAFEERVLERTERYEIIQHSNGIVTKALREGTVDGVRLSMDQYLDFPVKTLEDFRQLKRRYDPHLPSRYPPQWREERLWGWQNRRHVLVLGRNCAAGGFYWRAREWMGTEGVSYGWYDQPELMHEMMEFFADFTIEVSRPIVEAVGLDYFNLNEDFAMKSGPLLSPETFKKFIYPHLRRLVDFFKSHGTRYITLDSDGNCEPLIPLLMDAGIDAIWPLERAAGMDPIRLRKKFGKGLRLWGGVDKRVLTQGPREIEKHLYELAPLIEEGGFIPTVDHTIPPDVSWENFCHYMAVKKKLLAGRL
ncbi:MAG: hypothetical protein N0A15_05780 [Anaerolineae bacterium]|nr:hypothetical protein [Anaerolineae bacterium]